MSDKKEISKISSVPPPSELPSFVVQQQNKEKSDAQASKFQAAIPPQPESQQAAAGSAEDVKEEDEKGINLPQIQMQDIAQALSPLTEGVKNSVFYGWMKDSLKTGMEVAKDGVQKVVVTLDPQMGNILYSGGDMEVVVSSANEDKVDPVRDAFQQVFKKATIYGRDVQAKSIAAQPVGFQSAELSAKERINQLRLNENFIDKTILSVENFLLEVSDHHWYDLGMLLLSDSKHNITVKTFTQMTPIPYEIFQILPTETPKDYDKKDTGYSVTIGSVMSQNLDVPHYEWHKCYTSIERRDMIYAAAKSLATIYKRELQLKSSVPIKKTDSTAEN